MPELPMPPTRNEGDLRRVYPASHAVLRKILGQLVAESHTVAERPLCTVIDSVVDGEYEFMVTISPWRLPVRGSDSPPQPAAVSPSSTPAPPSPAPSATAPPPPRFPDLDETDVSIIKAIGTDCMTADQVAAKLHIDNSSSLRERLGPRSILRRDGVIQHVPGRGYRLTPLGLSILQSHRPTTAAT